MAYAQFNWTLPSDPKGWMELKRRIHLGIGELQEKALLDYLKHGDLESSSAKFGISVTTIQNLAFRFSTAYDNSVALAKTK